MSTMMMIQNILQPLEKKITVPLKYVIQKYNYPGSDKYPPVLFQNNPLTPTTSFKLTPYGEGYPYFQTEGKNTQESQCAKSRSDYIPHWVT